MIEVQECLSIYSGYERELKASYYGDCCFNGPNKDYAKALEFYAETNLTSDKYNTIVIYLTGGYGVEQNLEKAFNLGTANRDLFYQVVRDYIDTFEDEHVIEKACKMLDCFNLYTIFTFMEAQNRNDKKHRARLLRILRTSAKEGWYEAQIALGCYYQYGIDIPRNYLKAVKYYEKAYIQFDDNVPACDQPIGEPSLSDLNWSECTCRNKSKERMNVAKADICYELGEIFYYGGYGVKANKEKALNWYIKTDEGCHFVAEKYFTEENYNFCDLETAIKCLLKYTFNWGQIEGYIGCEEEFLWVYREKKYADMICKHLCSRDIVLMARRFPNETEILHNIDDRIDSYYYFQKAYELGDTDARAYLAEMYIFGWKGNANLDNAISLLEGANNLSIFDYYLLGIAYIRKAEFSLSNISKIIEYIKKIAEKLHKNNGSFCRSSLIDDEQYNFYNFKDDYIGFLTNESYIPYILENIKDGNVLRVIAEQLYECKKWFKDTPTNKSNNIKLEIIIKYYIRASKLGFLDTRMKFNWRWCYADESLQELNKALLLFDLEEYESAYKILSTTDFNNVDACCVLGYMYKSGCYEEIKKDLNKAYNYFLKASKLGPDEYIGTYYACLQLVKLTQGEFIQNYDTQDINNARNVISKYLTQREDDLEDTPYYDGTEDTFEKDYNLIPYDWPANKDDYELVPYDWPVNMDDSYDENSY